MAGVLNQLVTPRFAIYNADAMDVLAAIPDDSIHATIYSPPFGGLYHYSSDDRDLSNARDYDEFLTVYGFFVEEIFRVTIPGRTVAVHAALVPTGNTGRDQYTDLPGDVIRAHQARGWHFIARHVIWKEPLAVRLRTMAKNLAHKTIVDDAALGGVAAPDELLVFRKPGADSPINHPQGLTGTYAGNEQPPAELAKYRGWAGDQTPFMGVGSEVYAAVRMGRYGIGAELKPTYYEQALRNMAAVDQADTGEDTELFPAIEVTH